MRRGVYFLANDAVYDVTVAFLNSLRVHSAHLPLCWIPFDDNSDRLRRLAERYDFIEFDDAEVLRACDDLSLKFHESRRGHYRKLAIWSSGPFREFAYIDVDTVLVHDLEFAFGGLADCDVLVSHSDMREVRHWVWKDTIDAAGILDGKQIAFAASTGFMVSSKAFATFEELIGLMEAGLVARDHMELQCMEQAPLNYAIVTSGKRYTSLSQMVRRGLLKMRWSELYAGTPGWHVENGQIFPPMLDNGRRVFLVHWAGFTHPDTFPYADLWRFYRDLPTWGVRTSLPSTRLGSGKPIS